MCKLFTDGFEDSVQFQIRVVCLMSYIAFTWNHVFFRLGSITRTGPSCWALDSQHQFGCCATMTCPLALPTYLWRSPYCAFAPPPNLRTHPPSHKMSFETNDHCEKYVNGLPVKNYLYRHTSET